MLLVASVVCGACAFLGILVLQATSTFWTVETLEVCINYFPAVAILGRADPLGAPAITGWIAPLAGPVFLGLCLQVWNLGVRRYRSTGS